MRRALVRFATGGEGGPAPHALAAALLVAAAYCVGARVGIALTFAPQPVSPLWPPNAILLAGLLLTPPRAWWAIVLATFPAQLAANVGLGFPQPVLLGWLVANVIQALLGAVGVRRLVRDELRFDGFRAALVFVLVAGVLAPLPSTFLHAGVVALSHWGTIGFWELWRRRYLSNVLAVLTVTPAILTAAHGGLASLRSAPRARRAEAALLAALLLVLSAGVFATHQLGTGPSSLLLYVPLPLLLWAALRFGPGGTSAGILVVALVSIWSAVHGLGPFASDTPEATSVPLQLFLIVTGVPLLLLATVLAERRRADSALHENAYRMALAADAADLGFWTVDLVSQRRWVSDHLRRMHGLAPDVKITSTTLTDRIHPEDREQMLRAQDVTLATREPLDQVYRIVRPDGTVRWLHVIGRVVRVGAGEQIIGVMADVTERREAEAAVREQEQRLAHLARLAALGELSGAIAHELNQPLTAILANAQTAVRMLGRGPLDASRDVPELRAMLGDIVDDDRRAGGVLKRIRGLLRNEPLTTEPLRLGDLAREVLAITRGVLLEHQVVAQLDLPAAPLHVLGDRVHLQQVLVNLVRNACESMDAVAPAERRLTITAAMETEGQVCLSIRDAGPGIAVDPVQRIFEPFVSTKAEGLGLGLAICRTIVAAHGGRLWAESGGGAGRGRGATFHVVLPMVEAPEQLEVPAADPARATAGAGDERPQLDVPMRELYRLANATRQESRRLVDEQHRIMERLRGEQRRREDSRWRVRDDEPDPGASGT